jgi:hypothetical protein
MTSSPYLKSLAFVAIAATILFLSPIYYTFFRSEAFSLYHDDGLYLVTAQSLAKSGTYAISSLPEPIPQSKYPVLYPALLSLLIRLDPSFPTNLWSLKLLSLTFALAWFVIAGLYLARRYSPTFGCAVLAFVLLSPWCIYLSGSMLPDLLFSSLSLISLLSLSRTGSPFDDKKTVLLSALLASAAFLVSTKGITVILAASAFLVLHRKWKHVILFTALAGALCLPWCYWQSRIQVPSDPILQYYSKASYSAGHIFGNLSLPEACNVLKTNVYWIADGFVQLMGISFPRGLLISYLFAIALALLAGRGIFLSIRSGITAVDVWFGIYGIMLLCWVWPPSRYLVPLFPIFLGYAGYAYVNLLHHWGATRRFQRAAIVLPMACLVAAAYNSDRIARITKQTDSPTLVTDGGPENWRANKALCDWIEKNTPPNAIIAANLDPLVYLRTGRKSVRLFAADPYLLFYSAEKSTRPLGDVAKMRSNLIHQKVSYLAISPMDYYEEAHYVMPILTELIRTCPGCIRLSGMGKHCNWQIWKVDQSKLVQGIGAPLFSFGKGLEGKQNSKKQTADFPVL